MGHDDGLTRADPKLAPREFGAPRPSVDARGIPVVVTELAADEGGAAWRALCERWIGLAPHPNIVGALRRAEPDGVELRYPALDWARAPSTDFEPKQLARWFEQIALALGHVSSEVLPSARGLFARPDVYIDVGDEARLVFRPCEPGSGDALWPPELASTFPVCDERALVYVAAAAAATLVEDITEYDTHPIGELIAECVARSPLARPAAFPVLYGRIEETSRRLSSRRRIALAAWDRYEAGAGWLAVDQPARARKAFEAALETGGALELALEGRARALHRLGQPQVPWRPPVRGHGRSEARARAARTAWRKIQLAPDAPGPWVDPSLRWDRARERGAALEAAHAYEDAVRLYLTVVPCGDAWVAAARCYLATARPGLALDYATRALALDEAHLDARRLRCRARLAYGQHDEALADADALVAAAPDDGAAHYLRGRCLLKLGRPLDAREAFDRACGLSPQLLAAMLLRREAARTAGLTRAKVGAARPQELAVPAHVPDAIRGALAVGDAAAAITALEALDDDAAAQLLLGACLAFAARPGDALAAYARAAELDGALAAAAAAGAARALLALGRAAEALARLDELLVVTPDDSELVDDRARALAALGRTEEAELARTRVARHAAAGSEARVRGTAR